MLLLALRPKLWMAFNPDTGAVHKVWDGDMDFRGKVWDFSQDNSRPKGTPLYEAPDAMELTMVDPPAGNSSKGYHPIEATFDSTGWQRVFLAFDETSRKARFMVTVFGPQGQKQQWFESATSVDSDTSFQWNFKQIQVPQGQHRLTIEDPLKGGKKIRDLRLFGDRAAWFNADGTPCKVNWKGYWLVDSNKNDMATFHKLHGVEIKYDVVLKSGQVLHISHRPEVFQNLWCERMQISGSPTARVDWVRPPAMPGIVSTANSKVHLKGGDTLFFTYARTSGGAK